MNPNFTKKVKCTPRINFIFKSVNAFEMTIIPNNILNVCKEIGIVCSYAIRFKSRINRGKVDHIRILLLFSSNNIFFY